MVLLPQLWGPNPKALTRPVRDEALGGHPATGRPGSELFVICLRHSPITDAVDMKQRTSASGEGERWRDVSECSEWLEIVKGSRRGWEK